MSQKAFGMSLGGWKRGKGLQIPVVVITDQISGHGQSLGGSPAHTDYGGVRRKPDQTELGECACSP